jgi:integrase
VEPNNNQLCHTCVTQDMGNDMASIRKRKGKYQAQIRRSGFLPISRTFLSKADAQTWVRQIESSLDRGDLDQIKLQQHTLNDLILQYEKEITPQKKQARQEKYRLQWLKGHKISKVRLDKLGPEHISKYRDNRLENIQCRGSDGAQAVRHDLNLLSNIFSVAAKEWGIPIRNLVQSVSKPSPSKARQRRLTTDEQTALLANAPEPLKSMIKLALETGMRRGEIHRFHPDHIDQAKNLLSIPITKNGHPRTIPLSQKAAVILGNELSEYPFQMSEPKFRYRWEALLIVTGIEDLHFHDLRHEAISRFFEIGLSVPEVALISGHRDPRMLFRYTHLRAEDVVEKLK